MNLEYKTFQFKATSVTTEQRNGVPVGIIEGYASTWELDRGNDQIKMGAFTKTIQDHMGKGRQIRMYAGHDNSKLIGGYPIEYVREDEKGLLVRGEVNLEVQDGQESYSLAKQGVLCDMSIGFSIPNYKESVDMVTLGKKTIRVIKEIDLWEISLVPEPMNAGARITAVKSLTMPVAERATAWDAVGAETRIKELNEPTSAYMVEGKLLFCDVVDGVITAIPKAIFACAATICGARGTIDLTEDEVTSVKKVIDGLYKKMGLSSPFDGDGVDITLVEACNSPKEVEQLLLYRGFSHQASKTLVSILKKSTEHRDDGAVDSDKTLTNQFATLKNIALAETLKNTMRCNDGHSRSK